MDDASETAGVLAPPPLIFAGPLVAALAASRFVPLPALPSVPSRMAGAGLLAAAAALRPSAFRRMRAGGTNVNPYRPTSAIIDEGPFRYSRNPMYVSMALIYAGTSLLARKTLPFLLLPGVLDVMHGGVIAREEAYLERKFGAPYLAYKSRVRRWL